jgi:peptide subunit release factor 1 (eRF1)
MENERYSIECRECGDHRFLIPDTDSGSFRCPDCDTIYYDEDGVWDNLEAAEHYATYKGAKLAGLIRDPDWDDDRGVW